MAASFVLCDVFADRPFAGNQLAVFLDARHVGRASRAELARELGWSEVTFVTGGKGGAPFRVSIWTPFGELPFAGHPTIGTAVVLAAAGLVEVGWTVLELGIGQVAIEILRADRSGGRATMTQRAPIFGVIWEDRARLAHALGLSSDDLVPELPAQLVSTGLAHVLVPIRSHEALARAAATPDLARVTGDLGVHWAYLFSTDTPQATGVRARLLGSDGEDAGTGSAAGPLGAYLVQYGVHRSGVIAIEQGIEMGRPSRIEVDVPQEGGELGPVRVSGEVRIWGRGTLETPDAPSRML